MHFSQNYFLHNQNVWEYLFKAYKPLKILEIGSFEGQSTCFMIDKLSQSEGSEIHCVDTWEGGKEHGEVNMQNVEQQFRSNIQEMIDNRSSKIKVIIHKGLSKNILPSLKNQLQSNFFDLIYIDGSHESSDVLYDAVSSFDLLKRNGLMIFDDYLWGLGERELTDCPKLAIDAFTNCYSKKIEILHKLPHYQLYLRKL